MEISIYLLILFILLALVVGGGAVWLAVMRLYKQRAERILKEAQESADQVILEAHKTKKKELHEADSILEKAKQDAEIIKQQKVIEAKEYALQLKGELEERLADRTAQIQSRETTLQQLEQTLTARTKQLEDASTDLERERKQMAQQEQLVAQKQEELSAAILTQQAKLEEIGGLSAAQAREQLIESLRLEARDQAAAYTAEVIEEAKMNASQEARRLIVATIQRIATETSVENSVSVFHIDNDEVKGRIIGREGRNIRALEAATGVEIIVDDTPEAIVLSAFDPVRREIARLALHQLVQDGRIHPARIEEVVDRVSKQIEEEIIETGKRTIIDLGIHGMHPELVRLVGKMKYRSSYGQNLLQHARETANLCATMASELGLNAKKARRAGLLHDIGKVSDEEPELPHAILGMKLCEKYKEKPDICNAVGSHHDEIEMSTLIAPIVQVCDAISGARPGARREIAEAYIKRLKALEDLALSYPGVIKTYAIQAGRELRVVVGADKVDDAGTIELSNAIAERVQDELTYPGQVKITVIRERRVVSYAK